MSSMVLDQCGSTRSLSGAGRPGRSSRSSIWVDRGAKRSDSTGWRSARRNMIAPGRCLVNAHGPIYDSGRIRAPMDEALSCADWAALPRETHSQAKRRANAGVSRLACFLKSRRILRRDGSMLRFEGDGGRATRSAPGAGHGPEPLTTLPALSGDGWAFLPSKVRLNEGRQHWKCPRATPSVASFHDEWRGSAMAMSCR